jgi:hypothetical protein
MVLYQSELYPAGARHTALHHARLSAAPRVHEENEEDEE